MQMSVFRATLCCGIIIQRAAGFMKHARQRHEGWAIGDDVVAAANRKVLVNNLGGKGPDDTTLPPVIHWSPMLLLNMADGSNAYIDMVVTNTTPYHPKKSSHNGLNERFAQINLAHEQTVGLLFTFVYTDSGLPVKMPDFNMTFYDLDGPSGVLDVETVTVDNADFKDYIVTDTTDLDVQELENVTTFTSGSFGNLCDNPTRIDQLGIVHCDGEYRNQRDRAFALYMKPNRSEYHFKFTIRDTGGTGRNFLIGTPASFDYYKEEPTQAPTSAPTKYPTKSPTSDSGSSEGDPHVSTVNGAKFDIVRTGVFTLLAIPGSSPEEHSELQVHARVEAFGDICAGRLYITNLHFTGEWLGDLGSLEFATNVSQDEGAKIDNGVEITVGSVGKLQDFQRLKVAAPAEVAEVTEFQVSRPEGVNQHVTMLLVKLKLGPTIIKVRHVLQRERSGYSSALWFTASGLSKIQSDVGGLLGHDDHTFASTVPAECSENALWRLPRHSVRASAWDGSNDAEELAAQGQE